MSKPIVVAATYFWAQTDKINDMSGKYQVNIGKLSDRAVEALEANGIDVKNKGDDQGNFITVKSANPIKIQDSDGLPLVANVGNGSTGRAVIGFYDWTYKSKSGRSPSLNRMIVDDLIEYGDAAAIDDLEVL